MHDSTPDAHEQGIAAASHVDNAARADDPTDDAGHEHRAAPADDYARRRSVALNDAWALAHSLEGRTRGWARLAVPTARRLAETVVDQEAALAGERDRVDRGERERDEALADRDLARNERQAALMDTQQIRSERDAAREEVQWWEDWENKVIEHLHPNWEDDIAQIALLTNFIEHAAKLDSVIENAREADGYEGNALTFVWDDDTRTLSAVDRAVVAERDALAHVIEQIRDAREEDEIAGPNLTIARVHSYYAPNVDEILDTAPAVSLARHDAEVWEAGVRAGREINDRRSTDAVLATNPHRAGATS